MPMAAEKTKAMAQASHWMARLLPVTLAATPLMAIPTTIPIKPPTTVIRADSTRNWSRMVVGLAPRALRMPISRRRSVTVSSGRSVQKALGGSFPSKGFSLSQSRNPKRYLLLFPEQTTVVSRTNERCFSNKRPLFSKQTTVILRTNDRCFPNKRALFSKQTTVILRTNDRYSPNERPLFPEQTTVVSRTNDRCFPNKRPFI